MFKKIVSALTIMFLLFSLQACSLFEPNYIRQIEEYSKMHDEFSFGEVLDFEWDEAFNDLNSYGLAEEVKELSGYDFEVEHMGMDTLRRLLFFKNGKLVKEVRYAHLYFRFPNTVTHFFPATIFTAEWLDDENKGETHTRLYIELKDT